MHCKVTCILYKKQAHFSQLFCLQIQSVTLWQSHDRKSRCLRGRRHSSILYSPSGFFSSYFINEINFYSCILTLCVFICHMFSYHPFYFDFHSARIIFDVSSGFYFWNVNRTPTWHLSKMLKFAGETTMHCKVTCILYKKQTHLSQLFCLQVRSVTPWQLHDMKSRCLKDRRHSPQCTHYFWRVFRFLFLERKQDSNVTSVKNVKVCF
jgi:hypothetical protein